MTLNLIADVLVACLLVATIVTCFILTKRIERLKADEAGMRQTVGALITATDNAERAIAGLKSTLGDCDRTLEERLRTAERHDIPLIQIAKTLRHLSAPARSVQRDTAPVSRHSARKSPVNRR